MSGTHTIRRNYHYCEGCRHGFYPRDEFLGLPREGELSSELEKRVADFAVNDPYDVAEVRWSFHYAHGVSANQFRQVAKRLGQQIEGANPYVLQAALLSPPKEAAETLYVMSDGSMVPMREGKWNEVKVGIAFRAEDHLSHLEASRGELTRARYVAVLGGQEEFKAEMDAAIRVENAVCAKRIAWIGDGAPANWHLASTLCPTATQVLDWHHAVEHGMSCGKALLGEEDPGLGDWKKRIEQLLMGGNIERTLSELMACLPETETELESRVLNDLVRYFRTNESRMRYAQFRREGLLIGSGIVESAHRHVIQIRMKRAGQHWGTMGGRRMARLRAAYRTCGPSAFYDTIGWSYRSSTHVRIPKPTNHRASNR